MKIIITIYNLIIYLIKDFIALFKSQNNCDLFDIYQIVLFGLLINALYGVMHNFDFGDIVISISSSYGIMRFRKDIKDNQC